MSYQALYRVYRPQTFAALIGQDAISQTLLNALRHQRLAHAYLFCGPRGTGKTSTSKILAKAVNCLNPQNGEPCNECENCRAINEDRFLDVIEIDAASNRGIDEIRNIREQVRFTPSMGKRKVYIIDEVHMLTTEAFNALLKTLEEPPEHVLFILATTDPQKVPKTVLSRTQRFDFHRIPTAVLAAHLRDICDQEGIDATDDALTMIAKNAAGGMRDAISLLDQTIAFAGDSIDKHAVTQMIGGLDDEALAKLIDALSQGDTSTLFHILEELLAQGSDARALMQSILVYLRDLLLTRVGSGAESSVPSDILRRQASAFSLRQLEQLLAKAAEAERDMRIAPDSELVLELTLVEMALLLHDTPAAPAAPTKGAHLPLSGNHPKATQSPSPSATAASGAAADEQPAAAKPQAPAPPASEDDNATLEALRRLWPQTVEALKDVSIRIHAFVKPAELVRYENGTLTLRWPRGAIFNCKQMRMTDNQKILADTLATRWPHPIKFNCELEEEPQKDPTIDLAGAIHQVFGEDVPIEIIDEKPKHH
ncbi:MAG: DNA polymerase III subunit gamma/tau [Peptococcaceae bacterium]|nr:DNA polymerase III subunit gamma/tau [Peptococcaceae bacterium]